MTEAQLAPLVGPDRSRQWASGIGAMLVTADAVAPLRAAHFLAQVLHETAGLRVTAENLNYSAEGLLRTWPTRFTPESAARMARQPPVIANHVYGARMGNVDPGDGWRYRGRGCIQLTGRSNYGSFAADTGSPAIAEPDRVAVPPDAATAAAWYWARRGINRLADADDLEAVTRAVNGGLNGLADRRKWLAAAKDVLARPAEPAGPERVGDFETFVIHGLTVRNILSALDAVLDGDGTASMGPAVASVTAGRKIDVRLTA